MRTYGPSPRSNMRGNLSAWSRRLPPAAVLLILAFPAAVLGAEWYASDAAGLALETVARSRALRLDHALSVETLGSTEAPPEVVGYIAEGGRVEQRTLWEKGKETRRSLAAWDRRKILRLEERTDESGRISRERYDAEGRLSEESTLEGDGSGTATRYRYEGAVLASAESVAFVLPASAEKSEPTAESTAEAPAESPAESPAVSPPGVPEELFLWKDTYRYGRSGALLSVERSSSEGEAQGSALFVSRRGAPLLLETRSPDGYAVRTRFDAWGRPIENASIDSEGAVIGAVDTTSYEADADKGGPAVRSRTEGEIIVETQLDGKGRVVSETRKAKDGTLIEELTNAWKGDRLASVERKLAGTIRLTEYEYDAAGDRSAERDFRNGTLERKLNREGDTEVEELFAGGKLVMRATWTGGMKTKEERVRGEAR